MSTEQEKSLPATYVEKFHDEALCRRMEYCMLGATGLQVSKISMGGGTLSAFYGDLDVKEAIETIHQALRCGINYIDTAPYYGQGRSEEVLGMALKDVPREAYYIATKVGRYELDIERMFDFSAKKTRASVERSLQLLGLDYVDIIQIHDIEFAPNLEIIINECLPELEKLVSEGKAKFIGVTGYPISRLKECIQLAPQRFQVVLTYARNTLLDNTLNEYMSFFEREQLGIVCAAAHALGILTNAGPQKWHPASEELKAIGHKAAEICKANDIELGKLAMYHALQLAGVSTVLCGMQTRRILNSNLEAFYNGLTSKEQDVLQRLQSTVFTSPSNWEGGEIERYWHAMNGKSSNK